MRVLLTAAPDSHAAYAELAAEPPPGVSYSWIPSHPAEPAAVRPVLRQLLRVLKLPNVGVIPPGSPDAETVHSFQRLLLTRRPWVVDIEHGQPFVGTRFSRLRSRFTREGILMLLGSDACRAILPWSETASQAFVATFKPRERVLRKIRVVYPAIRPLHFHDEPAPRDRCSVLFVANKPEQNFLLKGGRELVAAFSLVRERRRHLTLVIVGPVPTASRALYENVPGLTLTGAIPPIQIDQLYRSADIYAMPTFSDTFGMVFLEAMAHGLPIVALDRPYTREIVRNGEVGLLVPMPSSAVHWCTSDGRFTMDSDAFISRVIHAPVDAGIVRSLADALERLIDDVGLRRRLGTAGRDEVLTGRFAIARRNAALAAVYSEGVGPVP